MKRVQIFAAAALSLLAVGAQAESYEGVHAPVSAQSRADMNAEAVRAASAPDQNVTRGSRGPETVKVSKDRALVSAEAVRTANAPDQNVVGGSRVNSRVIPSMPHRLDEAAKSAAAGANKL